MSQASPQPDNMVISATDTTAVLAVDEDKELLASKPDMIAVAMPQYTAISRATLRCRARARSMRSTSCMTWSSNLSDSADACGKALVRSRSIFRSPIFEFETTFIV